MASKATRQLVMLVGLLVVLGSVLAYQFRGSEPRAATPREAASRRTTPQAPAPSLADVSVGLARLSAPAAAPLADRRNPFTFGQRLAPAPESGVRPPASAGQLPTGSVGPAVPAGPPPPQPITLKFIGTVTVPSGEGRVAVLSDGKFVYHGREGDIIDGRYRIVRIGEESVQMEHVDGRGRQTIRLTGA